MGEIEDLSITHELHGNNVPRGLRGPTIGPPIFREVRASPRTIYSRRRIFPGYIPGYNNNKKIEYHSIIGQQNALQNILWAIHRAIEYSMGNP